MHTHIEKLYRLAGAPERRIIGLMSGTSLDGLDIALCRMQGSGLELRCTVERFATIPYGEAFRRAVRAIFSRRDVDLEEVCLLHPWIAEQHAALILQTLADWEVAPAAVDLIASHGQTVYHAPAHQHQRADYGNATLQLGDGDHLAARTGIITLSDFRQKHLAAGGEGAPLAVYGDYLLFSDPAENRIMLNLGGIANFTYLPASRDPEAVFSTDVGPGNTLMDAYISRLQPGRFYDEYAALARSGTVAPALLSALLDHPFFDQGLPKTTGPELFNLDYLARAQARAECEELAPADVMATLNRFTAEGVAGALLRTLPAGQPYVLYLSGGGMHNPLLVANLRELLPYYQIRTTDDLDVLPDAKEAVLFAVLANECVAGRSDTFGNPERGVPRVTMGKVSFPD